MKRFPIAEQQFLDWLDEKPRATAGTAFRCPIETACIEIKGTEGGYAFLDSEWPKWVCDFMYKIATSPRSCTRTRGGIRKLLE